MIKTIKEKIRSLNIRTRTLLNIWITVLLSLFLASLLNHFYTRTLVSREIDAKMSGEAEVIFNKIRVMLVSHSRLPDGLARYCETFRQAPKAQNAEILKKFLSLNEDAFGCGIWFEPFKYNKDQKYYGPYVYRRNNHFFLTEYYASNEYHYPSWYWYRIGIDAKTAVVWTDPYYDEHTGIVMVTCTAPFYDEKGIFLGVATGDIDLSRIQQIVSNIRFGITGQAFLLTRNGLFISGVDRSKVMQTRITSDSNTDYAALGKRIISEKKGIGFYRDQGDLKRVFYAPLQETGWILCLSISEAEVNQPLHRLFLYTAAITVIILLITALLGIRIADSISRPIVNLNNRLTDLAREHLSEEREGEPILPATGYEIRTLTENFDRLSNKLRKYLEEQKKTATALRDSENKYREILNQMEEGYFEVDLSGNLLFFNPSLTKIIGYEPEEINGSNYRKFTDEIKGTAIYDKFNRVFTTGKSENLFDMEFIRKDGSRIQLEANAAPMIDSEGLIRGFRGTVRNVTERKKMEGLLLQKQKLEAVGTLAGGIAHDFNNILSGIIGYSELCLKAVQDRPKVHHNMEQVLKAAERAKELVQQILTFSRKAGQEKKPVSLAYIAKEVVNFMRASLPTTIEIMPKIEVSSDIIMADPTQMHQVLMNLCTNAGHAMKETGGVLEIGLKEVDMDAVNLIHHPDLILGRYLELSVRDTGQGIPQENLVRIFEPYFTTKEKGEGTGLGLAVVHGIVKDHGGELSVYSEVGRGSIFRIYLPLMEKQAEGDRKLKEVVLRGKGETILFIDDEKMVADFSREMLEELGYKVVTETDPVAAIQIFKENSNKFDIVITDKTMPRLTGFDVIREIREVRADMPVVLCSGYQDKEDMEKLQARGINQFITKPARMSVLAKAIRAVLDKEQA